MPITHIIRPTSILSTPKRLAHAIHSIEAARAVRLVSGSSARAERCPTESTICLYPSISRDSSVSTFYRKNKAEQRKDLQAAGLPTVSCATTHAEAEHLFSPTGKFVVRPLRHSQGRGWRITSDYRDFMQGTEYLQPLIQKRREFRALFVFGRRICILRKRNPQELPWDRPWNHTEGSMFVTINDERNNFLRGSGVLEMLDSFEILFKTHLCGVDIIQDYNEEPYVLEFNACPSLAIEANLQKVASAMINHFSE